VEWAFYIQGVCAGVVLSCVIAAVLVKMGKI